MIAPRKLKKKLKRKKINKKTRIGRWFQCFSVVFINMKTPVSKFRKNNFIRKAILTMKQCSNATINKLMNYKLIQNLIRQPADKIRASRTGVFYSAMKQFNNVTIVFSVILSAVKNLITKKLRNSKTVSKVITTMKPWNNETIRKLFKSSKFKIQNYVSALTKPKYSRLHLNFFTLIIGSAFFTLGMYFAISGAIKLVHALTETTTAMPTDVAFNAEGYADGSGEVSVLSAEVRMATSSSWWNGGYLYKKAVTLKNNNASIKIGRAHV